jgi:hypothetical protein
MFKTALEEAKQLDEEYKATGRLRGPLHGVPISFKDLIEIRGKDASVGFSRLVGAHRIQIAGLTGSLQLVPPPVCRRCRLGEAGSSSWRDPCLQGKCLTGYAPL